MLRTARPPRSIYATTPACFGVPPAARRALRELENDSVTRYPHAYAREPRPKRSRATPRVRPEEIVTGCGSDDVLDSAFRAFATPGDRRSRSPIRPSSMIPASRMQTGSCRRRCRSPPISDLDVDGLLRHRRATDLRLCSPNNPTRRFRALAVDRAAGRRGAGVRVPRRGLRRVRRRRMDRARRPARSAPGRAHALQGASASPGCGSATRAGSAALVAEVREVARPVQGEQTAERAAVAALEHDREWVTARIDEVRAERDGSPRGLARDRHVAAVRATRTSCWSRLPDAAGSAAPDARRAVWRCDRSRGSRGSGDATADHDRAASDDGAALAALREAARVRATIFDYGAGNLHSLGKALELAGARGAIEPIRARSPPRTCSCCPASARSRPPRSNSPRRSTSCARRSPPGCPVSGSASAMQLLFESSEEEPGRGLGSSAGA